MLKLVKDEKQKHILIPPVFLDAARVNDKHDVWNCNSRLGNICCQHNLTYSTRWHQKHLGLFTRGQRRMQTEYDISVIQNMASDNINISMTG